MLSITQPTYKTFDISFANGYNNNNNELIINQGI